MKPRILWAAFAFIPLVVAAPAAWAADAAPAAAAPQTSELIPNRGAEFLSSMLGSYEATAAIAKPLAAGSKSMAIRVMADDRLLMMKKMSRRLVDLIAEKGWRVEPSLQAAADARLGLLLAQHNGKLGEMNILDALTEFHVETAKAALDELWRTQDADVADMAKRIIADQIDSIVTAKRIPAMIEREKQIREGEVGIDPYQDPDAVNPFK